MNPVKMIYVCDPAKAKTCRKSVCRQNPYSAVPVCEWTGNPEWAKTDAAGNPIIDWENTLLLLKQDIVRDVPAWDQVLDGPLVGPVLMLFLYIAGRPAVIEAVGHTMTYLVAQGGELVCYSLEFPRVQRDRTPVKRWNENREGLGEGHGVPIYINPLVHGIIIELIKIHS